MRAAYKGLGRLKHNVSCLVNFVMSGTLTDRQGRRSSLTIREENITKVCTREVGAVSCRRILSPRSAPHVGGTGWHSFGARQFARQIPTERLVPPQFTLHLATDDVGTCSLSNLVSLFANIMELIFIVRSYVVFALRFLIAALPLRPCQCGAYRNNSFLVVCHT